MHWMTRICTWPSFFLRPCSRFAIARSEKRLGRRRRFRARSSPDSAPRQCSNLSVWVYLSRLDLRNVCLLVCSLVCLHFRLGLDNVVFGFDDFLRFFHDGVEFFALKNGTEDFGINKISSQVTDPLAAILPQPLFRILLVFKNYKNWEA